MPPPPSMGRPSSGVGSVLHESVLQVVVVVVLVVVAVVVSAGG